MMTGNSRITGDGESSVYLPGNMIGAAVSGNSMRNTLITEFDLTKTDGGEISKDAAMRNLQKNVSVNMGKKGLVAISVKSPSPEHSMKTCAVPVPHPGDAEQAGKNISESCSASRRKLNSAADMI